MRISQEKEKYMDFYLKNICFGDELDLNCIKNMAELKEEWGEYISCSFDSEDEDFKEGYVTLMFCKPVEPEDTLVYIDSDIFYEGIERVCNEHSRKNPGDADILNNYLQSIRSSLKV